jgi:phage virion morphogenesis protein
MAEFTFDTDAWGELQKQIADMEARAKDASPATKVAAATLDTVIQSSFELSNSPQGEPWAPLAESTIAQRRRGSSRALVDTGQLKAATFTRASKTGVMFGVSGAPATYAGTHQFGTTKAGRSRNVKIKARPFLPLDDSGKPVFSGGRAAKWLKRAQKRVTDYILHGKR